MTVPVGIVAALAAMVTLSAKALRQFPLVQHIELDAAGLRLRVGERESAQPWSAFTGVEQHAGCVLLRGERGDVLLLAHRLSAEQRAALFARLAQVFVDPATTQDGSGRQST